MNDRTTDDSLLTSFWFVVPGLPGLGVTAFSRDDACFLLEAEGYLVDPEWSVIEGANILELDEHHVLPNAGPQCFRGVWYPCLNLGWSIPGAHHPLVGGTAVPRPPFVCRIHIGPRTTDK